MKETTTKRIWTWLTDLPDEYDHHDRPAQPQPQQPTPHIWNSRSISQLDPKQPAKRCFGVARTRQQHVEVIDLAADDTDAEEVSEGISPTSSRTRSLKQA